MPLCEYEREHNIRAALLTLAFSEEELAELMHQTYRVAFKALHIGRLRSGSIGAKRNCINEHDHGFDSCHKKKYFLRRARMLLKEIKPA